MEKMSSPRKPYFALTLATWFGCGYFPIAPGTAGSLAAVAIAWLLAAHCGFGRLEFAIMGALAFFAGIWPADRTARYLGKKDPRHVVIDEVSGQWFAYAGAAHFNWKSALAGFLLFRILDIWKPAPARQAEGLPGGWGIMADDVIAGLYAALVLWAAGCFNLY